MPDKKTDIKEKYEKLKKQHALPSFEALDSNFEISLIEKEENLLREIRKKITEKIGEFIDILNPLLQPETNIKDLEECKVFNDKEKKEMFVLYRKLMVYNREADLLLIDSNDKIEVDFINKFNGEWKKIKEDMKFFVSKLKHAWEKETEHDEIIRGYLG